MTAAADADAQKRHPLERLSLVVGLWPWLALAWFVFSALYTRARLGHWPITFFDNPKDPLILLTSYPLILSVFSVVLVLPATLILLAARQVRGVRPAFDKWAGAGLVGVVVYYLVVLPDPFGYLNWLLD